MFTNKGLFLVLTWSFIYFAVLVNFTVYKTNQVTPLTSDYSKIGLVALPLIGVLSDVILGRYKIIHYSQWVVWLAIIIYNALLIVKYYAWNSDVLDKLENAVVAMVFVGLSGIIANVIQLGVDQLTEASSSEIISYISWYAWTLSLANTVVSLSQVCLCGDTYKELIAFFLFPFLATVAVSSDCLASHWLVKEPVLHNPFKLIFQVLRYAAKNKYPRLRSAFTYWEDKPYSRIDLGKAKYGGPFTTEQVEDVKAFFYLVGGITLVGPITGILYLLYQAHALRVAAYTNNAMSISCSQVSNSGYITHCYERTFAQSTNFLFIVLAVPAEEYVISPLLTKFKFKCFPHISILQKTLIGLILITMYEFFLVAVTAVVYVQSINYNNSTCFYSLSQEQISSAVIHIDYRWLVLGQLLYGIGVQLLITSGIQLICAQAPYSMKGTLIGFGFLPTGLSITFSKALFHSLHRWTRTSGVNCDVWLNVSLLLVTMLFSIMLLIAARKYHYRIREEILNNDQMFAVDYYNKYLDTK